MTENLLVHPELRRLRNEINFYINEMRELAEDKAASPDVISEREMVINDLTRILNNEDEEPTK